MRDKSTYRAARRNAAHEAAKQSDYHIGAVWRGASDYRYSPSGMVSRFNDQRRLPAVMRHQSKYTPHQGAKEMARRDKR